MVSKKCSGEGGEAGMLMGLSPRLVTGTGLVIGTGTDGAAAGTGGAACPTHPARFGGPWQSGHLRVSGDGNVRCANAARPGPVPAAERGAHQRRTPWDSTPRY